MKFHVDEAERGLLGKRWQKKKRRGGGGEDVLFGVVGKKIEGSRSKPKSS